MTGTVLMPIYIEDPEIIRLIQGISANWPKIGAAADHPLTEFFIHQRGQAGIWAPVLSQLKWIVIGFSFIAFLTMLIFIPRSFRSKRDIYLIVSLFLFMRISSYLKHRPRRVRSVTKPQLMLSQDSAQNCWIWLSGLTLSQFVAISFAYYYWLGSGLVRLRSKLFVSFFALDAVAIVLMAWYALPVKWIVIALQSVPVAYVLSWYFCNPTVLAQYSLWQLARTFGIKYDSSFVWIMLLLWAIGFAMTWDFTALGSIVIIILCYIFRNTMEENLQLKYETIVANEEHFGNILAPGRSETR